MPISYRAVHERSLWRKVQIHKTLDSAIDGKDGAKALLLRKGRVGEKWEQYGRPLCVFVWDSTQPNGYLLRTNPKNPTQVQIIELPLEIISRHEARQSCSEVEIKQYFNTTEHGSSQLEPRSIDKTEPPQGIEAPVRTKNIDSALLRDMTVKSWVQQNARGICEGCGSPAPFVVHDGTPFLEVHHVRSLADGGSDKISNAVALCPNCHRRAHHSQDRDEFKEYLYKTVSRLVLE